MLSIDKTFCGFRTVFFCFLFVFSYALPVSASNTLFTVEDVNVDITAQNAVAAREMAFEKAQLDAFTILKQRMLSESEAANLPATDVSTVSTLIQDFEISNEQLSSVRYKATYKFRFKDNAVKQFLSGADVQYTDMSASPALVLPFYKREGNTTLWSPYNFFMKAWNRADNLSGLVPLVVPLGDISDVQDIGDDDALDYHDRKLDRILARYEASEAIILIATPDERLARVESASDAALGSLEIFMYRTDRGRPEFVQAVDISAGSNDSLASFMDKAVQRVQRELRKDWKSRTSVRSSQNNNVVQVRVAFNSLKEWADTKKALKRVYAINDINIKSITPNEAYLHLGFQGDERRLALALQQSNFTLNAPRGNNPTQGSIYAHTAREPIIYDLSLMRYR